MKHLKIKINKLEFSWETILKDINFTLNKTDKISIVWPNGSGKTTLMKILTSEKYKKYDWFVENVWNLSLGYLHQIYSDNENKLVKQELREAFEDELKLEKQIKQIEQQMNKEENNTDKNYSSLSWQGERIQDRGLNNEDLIEKYTELLEQFNNIWWYDIDNKIHQVANGMKILDLLEKKLTEVSWWERTKIALAKILLKSPDILFLDEPTNFIDISSVEWLESYLQNKWNGWYVIISHDREFLG